MKALKILKRADILLVGIIFIAALFVSFQAYGKIAEVGASHGALIARVPMGIRHYVLLARNICVGEATSKIRFGEDLHRLEVKGGMRVKVQGDVNELNLDASAEFNSIGLHAGSLVTVQGKGLFLRFGTRNVDPMLFRFRIAAGERNFEYETPIPGPVTLRQNRDGSYRIEYLHFGNVIARYQHNAHHPLLQSFAIVEAGSETAPCAEYQRGELDLAPFFALFGQLQHMQGALIAGGQNAAP